MKTVDASSHCLQQCLRRQLEPDYASLPHAGPRLPEQQRGSGSSAAACEQCAVTMTTFADLQLEINGIWFQTASGP